MNQMLSAPAMEAAPPAALDAWLRRRVLRSLAPLRHGELVIEDAWGRQRLGASEGAGPAPAGPVHVQVDDPRFYRALALGGSVAAGEAYGEGLWRSDDPVGLVRLLLRNRDLLDAMETGSARPASAALRAWHALRGNTRAGARRNISAHYDLGNEFFGLFLSPDLMYSSALWAEGDTLESASTRKLDALCRKLGLREGLRVMEVGTGWGGLALHAARHYGCHVTTTTISREQHALASKRVAETGLQDRVTVLLSDYRDLEGRFDRVVSIEMIEAIGARYQEAYFGKLAALLGDDGLALVQAITIEDHRYEQALGSVDFIKRHIFPGSFIPSIHAMLAASTRASDLQLVHMEDFGLSYARTLNAWRSRFLAAREQARALGYDERFLRLWDFYLAYCEGGFLERSIGVGHLLFARPGARPAHGDRWVAGGA
jgi:cyclopropane-fatty-acyl-phospholipid synthase